MSDTTPQARGLICRRPRASPLLVCGSKWDSIATSAYTNCGSIPRMAAPLHGYGVAGLLRQAGRFHGRLSGVFAAEAAAEVRHKHAYAVGSHAESLRQRLADAGGIAGAGPDGEAALLPFRHGGARLHGGMLRVGHPISGFQSAPRFRQALLQI